MQKIMRECDIAFVHFVKYIQHFQADPLICTMKQVQGYDCTNEEEKNSEIVPGHHRESGIKDTRLAKALYYALVLPGHCLDASPLPVAELLMNNHTVLNNILDFAVSPTNASIDCAKSQPRGD